MPKEENEVEGTVVRALLHQGKHVARGEDLSLPVGTARMLEGSGQFTTDSDKRKAIKAAAKQAKSGGAS